jgi:hypothetical protein
MCLVSCPNVYLAKVSFIFNLWGKVMLYQLSYFRNMCVFQERFPDNGGKGNEKNKLWKKIAGFFFKKCTLFAG